MTHWNPPQTAVFPRRLHHGTFRSVVWVYLRCSAEISDALRCVGGDTSEYVHHGAHPSSLRITEDSGNPIRQRGGGPNVGSRAVFTQGYCSTIRCSLMQACVAWYTTPPRTASARRAHFDGGESSLMFMILSRMAKKTEAGSGLVKKSARLSTVRTYGTTKRPLSTISRMKK